MRVIDRVPCKACGLDSGSAWLSMAACYQGLSQRTFDVHRCDECALLFTYPDPSADDLAVVYGRVIGQESNDPSTVERHRQWVADRHWRPLLNDLKRCFGAGRLLDAGCSDGSFLDLAEDAGFEVHGFDRAPAAIATAAHRHHDRVRLGAIEAMPYEDESFDYVRFCHVLEHLTDPVAALSALRRVLRPGGILSLALPVVDGPMQWALIRAAPPLVRCKLMRVVGRVFPPEHLTAWSTKALNATLSRVGFEVVASTYRNDAEPWLPGSRRYYLFYGALGAALRAFGSGINIELLARRIEGQAGRA